MAEISMRRKDAILCEREVDVRRGVGKALI